MADAAVVSGSIRAIEVAGREFPVDARSEAQLYVGQVANSVQVTGSGDSIVSQERTPWSLTGVETVISDDRGDLGFLAGLFNKFVAAPFAPGLSIPAPPDGPDREYLAEVVSRANFVPISVTLVDETVWTGSGTIVGTIPVSTKTGTVPLSFMGNGKMVKQ